MTWSVSNLNTLHYSFDQVPNPDGSLLRRFQLWFLAKTSVPLFFYFGRGIFQYSWGIVPHRTPINIVIGAPIPVTKVPSFSALN